MSNRSFGSLAHFASFCANVAVQHQQHHHALEEACVHLEGRVKQVIGTYDLSPRWPELAASTQAERVRLGFSPNDPLLRDGQHIRDTIRHDVTGDTGRVGTDDDVAVYQELGTRRLPPRSFLRLSAVEQEAAIVAILSKGLISTINETRAPSPVNRPTKSVGQKAAEQQAANRHFQRMFKTPSAKPFKDPSKTFQGWMHPTQGQTGPKK